MAGKGKRAGGVMDQIRCDEPSYLIWRWHPAGANEGESRRETAIRWGSSLRVKDGEIAVFVYNQKDGVMQDFIEGPYDEMIRTSNFPVLARIVGTSYEGGTPFQAEIYFINLAQIVQVKFGVPFFDVFDPRFRDFSVPVAVRGTISFHIADYREFIKLHRLNNFHLEDFQKQIRDVVTRYVKDTVANAPAANDIPVIQLETKTALITDMVELDLKSRLEEDFGVAVSGVDIGAIEIDKSSGGYAQLMNVTKGVTEATIQAEKEAKVRDIQMRQKIEAENYAETLRIQREEGQYAMHKGTQSANIGAFEIEKQAEVGVAGAEALGKMGEGGAGNINLGDGGSGGGFNMAGLMASMAVGGAVGQNIAGTMNNMMGSVNNQPGTTPPPIPTEAYHVVIGGQAAGPFNQSVLAQMAANGQLTAESMVWKPGMADWVKAGTVEELGGLFVTPPPIPPAE